MMRLRFLMLWAVLFAGGACGSIEEQTDLLEATSASSSSGLCIGSNQCFQDSGYLSSPKLVRINTGPSSKCAGAIVDNPCAVLTAAHCNVTQYDKVHRAGSSSTRWISHASNHPNGADIAVHCLTDSFSSSSYDIASSFPTAGSDPEFWMYGQNDSLPWGSQMQFLKVDASSTNANDYHIFPDCANDDSGGPVIHSTGSSEKIVGVHSGSTPGNTCAVTWGHMVGTRADTHRNWILSEAARCWNPTTNSCTEFLPPLPPEKPGHPR
ncbi:MAG: trypsin-like serine protease [Myxococcota bacterium]